MEINAGRIVLGVLVGLFILAAVQIAAAGTVFDADGNKVGTCKGSSCPTAGGGPGTPGTGAAPTKAKAASKSSSRSQSTAKATSKSKATSQSGATAAAATGPATASTGPVTVNVSGVGGGSGGGSSIDLSDEVPDVYAPNLVTSGDDMCVGSVSGGVGLSGLGAILGFTVTDTHCETIKAVKLLASLERPNAAIRRACMDEKMRKALLDECPAEPEPKETPRSSSPSFIH